VDGPTLSEWKGCGAGAFQRGGLTGETAGKTGVGHHITGRELLEIRAAVAGVMLFCTTCMVRW